MSLTNFSELQCPTLNRRRTLRSWAVFWWGEGLLLQGPSRTPSQHAPPPTLQYLEWMPSTNGPPRPFSWSTSWRSFSISSDRRPCARQTQGGVGAREGQRGESGSQRGTKRTAESGKSRRMLCKVQSQGPQARTTDHQREEEQLESEQKVAEGPGRGGLFGEGLYWNKPADLFTSHKSVANQTEQQRTQGPFQTLLRQGQ